MFRRAEKEALAGRIAARSRNLPATRRREGRLAGRAEMRGTRGRSIKRDGHVGVLGKRMRLRPWRLVAVAPPIHPV